MIAAALQYVDLPWLAPERQMALSRPNSEWVSSPWGGPPSSGGAYAPASLINSLAGITVWLGDIVDAPKGIGCTLTTPEVPAALAEIRDAFSLKTSNLSDVLHVSRQTIYNWLDGKPVDESNRRRVAAVRELALTWLRDHGKPMGSVVAEEIDGASLLSLLGAEALDERTILRKFDAIAARITAAEANRPPSARELAEKFGFEPVSVEEYRKNVFVAGLRYRRGR